MDKQALHAAILTHFVNEYEVVVGSARAIYEAATHEDARAENKYDTRGLEASYMAESLSKRALGIQQTINIYKHMPVRNFGEDDPVDLGALVLLEDTEGLQRFCFLGPRGGGARIPFGDIEVMVITAASPLGQGLKGSELGDEVCTGEASARKTWSIEEVH